jgi:O-antigen/teichoic acid export membrane protein
VAGAGIAVVALSLTPLADAAARAVPLLAPVIACVAGVGAARATAQVLTEHVRAFRDYRGTALGNGTAAQTCVALFLGGATVLGGTGSSRVLLIALAAGYCVEALIAAVLRHMHLRGAPRQFTRREVFSPFVWLSTLLSFALTQQDLWLVGLVATEDEIGLYAAPFRLVGLVLVPLLIVNLVVPPLIAGLNTQARLRELEALLRATATAAGLVSLAALAFLSIGAPLWLRLIFGGEFSAASPVLMLLALGQLAIVWTGSSSSVLLMTGRQKLLVAANGVALLASFALEVYAYRWWGIAGVAGACSFVLVLHNLTTWLLAWRLVGVRTDVDLRGVPSQIRRVHGQLRARRRGVATDREQNGSDR